jgi:hypothetical protein
MKKFLKLVPAFAMLLVAAILVSTSTYAWFSMNNTVQATNMQVRAVAEKGLLINEIATAGDSHWDEEATANQTASNPVLLYPTSTADGETWYHGASKKSSSAASATDASTLSTDLITGSYGVITPVSITSQAVSASAGSTAAREVFGSAANLAATEPGYYVKYTYYLKSAGAAIPLSTTAGEMNVKIASVVATPAAAAGNGTPANSADLDPALRVGIFMKASGTFYIFAPITGYTATYYVNAGASGETVTPNDGTTAVATDLTSLPASGSAGTPVEVYVWFEGEDAGLKSDNALATTLDNIDIDITFALEQIPTP